jgi:selenocysteine lyase/cysteine desulfurase
MTPDGGRAFDDERIAVLRAATPGTAHRNHLNNAGAGLMTRTTLAAVVDHLRLESEIGGYEAADARRAEVTSTYQALADLVGGRPDQVALFDNSTHAWNAAFYSVPLGPSDRIVTSRTEYGSNVAAYWQRAEQTGCEVVVVPDDENGQLDLDALRHLLDERTKVVGLAWIPTAEGIVNPAAEVGEIVRDSGALYLLDATQAVGQLDIDVEALRCDVLTGTGRKWLRGPRGTGFCWLSDRALDRLQPHVVDLASMVWDGRDGFTWAAGATRFETWEVSYANVIGFGQAVREALAVGMPAIEAQAIAMGDRLRADLRQVPGVRVHDLGERQSGIVTMSVDGHPAGEVADALAYRGINVTTTSPGHNQLDMKARGVHPLVRLSPHYYNTLEELEQAVEVIRSL